MASLSILWKTDKLVGEPPQLRGTVTMYVEDPTLGKLGIELQGCLCNRDRHGNLTIKPPMKKRFIRGRSIWVTDAIITPDTIPLLVRQVIEAGDDKLLPVWIPPMETDEGVIVSDTVREMLI